LTNEVANLFRSFNTKACIKEHLTDIDEYLVWISALCELVIV